MRPEFKLPKLPIPRIGHLSPRLERVDLAALTLGQHVAHLLPERTIRQLQVIPMDLNDGVLKLAMVDPGNLMALDDVRRLVKGVRIQPMVITPDDFVKLLDRQLSPQAPPPAQPPTPPAPPETLSDIVEELIDLVEEDDDLTSVKDLERASSDTPIVRMANAILLSALKQKASDIHIEPQAKWLKVRYRVDGSMQAAEEIPKQLNLALVSRFKVMAHLDIAEKRLPQDGRIRIRYLGKTIDFRVSTLPSKYGEKIVLRVLDNTNTVLGLDQLFVYPEILEDVRQMIQRPHGIVLVTGPTGSGKTTTLYSLLHERNRPDVNIVTAEDPIEYEMANITQVQAQPEIGLTFARILKAFLRQDPDIMLIGETRDKELAKIAIESALTGHLVFTSLHTNDAVGAITRLQEMDIDSFLIASATLGVIAQRLVKKLCPDCAIPYVADEHTLEHVGYPFRPGEDTILYRANEDGCDRCNKGYKGRIGCYEILTFDDDLRELVTQEANQAIIRQSARNGGMISLKDYSLRLVRDGLTSLEEVYRVTLTDEGDGSVCKACRSPVEDDFLSCPFCQAELQKKCGGCERIVDPHWVTCPSCQTSLNHKVKPIKGRTGQLAEEKLPRASRA